MGLAQKEIIAQIKCLDGTIKTYNFVALRRREAIEVFHLVLIKFLQALSSVSSDRASIGSGLVQALREVSFDDFWSAAKRLLRGVVIDGTEIADIENSDYFSEHIDELYLAVGHAIKGNYPAVFQQVEQALSGLFDKTGLNLE